jgi:DNA modification methylase
MTKVIDEFGLRIPLLTTATGEIIDGHLRLKAAMALGLSEVPTIVCDDWSDAQVKAFRLTVNRSATWATWNLEAVAEELAELNALHFDLDLTGFGGREIEELLAETSDQSGIDALSAVPTRPTSRPGDIWLCGKHRVCCGDATSSVDVSRLCGSTVPPLMVTDPPYGVNYDPTWREKAGLGVQRQVGLVRNDDRVDWHEDFRLFQGNVIYCWHAGLYAALVASSIEQCGFKITSQIIWAKQHFALSRGHYHWQHEPCWYAVRQGTSANWKGDRKQSTIWEISNLNPFGRESADEADVATRHGTQKPVELMRRAIVNHTVRGDVVYDPFLGSGSVLIAAETTGRICYGLEIDPGYVDLIVERWQKLSGNQAVLESDGRPFCDIMANRAGDEYAVAEGEPELTNAVVGVAQ